MKIHQWFIATKKNKFHPLALRTSGLIVFLAIFLVIPMLYNLITVQKFQVLGYATNVNVTDVYNLSNQERINVGVAPLSLNSQLNNAAAAKASDMVAKDYWAHISPDGLTPWTFINNAGYQYAAAGENLAKDFDLSSGVVAGWMGSQTHRDNVLNSAYKDVGYAVVNCMLQGEQTTLVVAEYGEPVAQQPIATTAPTQTNNNATSSSAPTATTTTESTTPTTTKTTTTNTAPEATLTTAKKTVVATTKTKPNTAPSTNSVKKTNNIFTNLATILPIRAYNSLNWGQKVSLLLLLTMILLFLMKHTLIWREQKRGFRHILLRSHPLGQAAILTVVLAFTLFSGVGVII